MAGSSGTSSNILHKITFKIKVKKPKILFWEKNYYPTQFKTFKYGIVLENISTRIFPGGKIKNVNIKSMEGKSLGYSSSKEYDVQKLNPNQVVEIWLEDLNSTLEGTLWVKGKIEAADANDIETYQFETTGDVCSVFTGGRNTWGNCLFVKSKSQEQQHRTNLLILLLTFLTVLQGIFGLKNIMSWLLASASGMMVDFGKWLIALGVLLSKK